MCLDALDDKSGGHASGSELHILERTSLTFLVQNCILAQAPNLTRFKISGSLPALHVNVGSTLLSEPRWSRTHTVFDSSLDLGSKVQEHDAHDRRRHSPF